MPYFLIKLLIGFFSFKLLFAECIYHFLHVEKRFKKAQQYHVISLKCKAILTKISRIPLATSGRRYLQ